MKDKMISENVAFAAGQSFEERKYWLNQFSGELTRTGFPYDYSQKTPGGRSDCFFNFRMDGPLFSKLTGISKGSDFTLHIVLTAGLVLLLHKYTESLDITVGTSIDKQDVEGEFINTVLALRNRLRPDMTFKELLFETRKTIGDAVSNQNYPIETLLYDLKLGPSPDQFPLFDVAVLLENIHDERYIGHIPCSITFSLLRGENALEGKIIYHSSRYDKSTVERIAGYYGHVMECALTNPDAKLPGLDVMTPGAREQILEDFNRTRAPYPENTTIYQLFEEQVEKKPDHIALVFGDRQLKFKELNDEADRLAALLRRKGVGPNDIIGIMVERSVEMIVGILGILKARAAYLPLDTEYPAGRLSYMLNDCSVKWLLTDGAVGEGIRFDGEVTDLSKRPHDSEDAAPYPGGQDIRNDHRAYVIYTSGSTGKPRGVIVPHASIVNTLCWRRSLYQFDESDTVLQVPSFSFDSSVEDIFTPLISGSRLLLIPRESRLDLNYLATVITHHNVTHFLIVPGFYKRFLAEMHQHLGGVKKVTVAGESFYPDLVREHFRKLPGVRLFNEYGPTETSVCGTVYEFSPDRTDVLIGKPIDNARCFIINKYGSVNPVGVGGRLFISGPGLAHGYANNPELTGEKFVPNPLKPGDLMYNTGDLARWRPDGNMEFLGRIDQQVKILGHRIELEEIEKQLLKIDYIKEAVVLAHQRTGEINPEEDNASHYLCAYVVSTQKLDITALRDELCLELPYYMVPAYYMELEKMPLTPNGKVDKKGLPLPELKIAADYVAPRGEMQEKVVGIWARELGVTRDIIGIHSNFFELGGDSLRATTLISTIHKEFNIVIPLIELFKSPTVAGLTAFMEKAEKTAYTEIQPVVEREYYPVSSAQGRMFLQHQIKGGGVSDNTPTVLAAEGDLDVGQFETVVQTLVDRHEAFRTSFEFLDNNIVQRIHKNVKVEIEHYNLEGRSESEAEAVIQDFIRPFDLGKAPLLRVGLVKLSDRKHLVMYDIHHIVRDGISTVIFIKEFINLFEGVPLPPLKIQYKDFAVWQNEFLRSDGLKKQEDFWLNEFREMPPDMKLPLDYPRPDVYSYEGARLDYRFDEDLTGRIRENLMGGGTTLYMVLFALYNILLSKYSGQEDVIVGTPVIGRPHADLQNVVGMFVNTLAMRNRPDSEMTFDQFLAEVRTNVLNAFDNQYYQFEELVKKLQINADTGRQPLFDTMFVVQNAFANLEIENEATHIKGVTFTPYPYEEKVTPFDIIAEGTEREEVIDFKVRYSTQLFKPETIQNLMDSFRYIAGIVADDKHIKLKDIKLAHEFTDAASSILEEVDADFEF